MVNCCKGKSAANGTTTTTDTTTSTASKGGSVEPIFPAELKGRAVSALLLPGEQATWYRPVTLEQLLALKGAHPELKLVGGNSEVRLSARAGVEQG
jgi:xanthine dehydrogenase/oxidase